MRGHRKQSADNRMIERISQKPFDPFFGRGSCVGLVAGFGRSHQRTVKRMRALMMRWMRPPRQSPTARV